MLSSFIKKEVSAFLIGLFVVGTVIGVVFLPGVAFIALGFVPAKSATPMNVFDAGVVAVGVSMLFWAFSLFLTCFTVLIYNIGHQIRETFSN